MSGYNGRRAPNFSQYLNDLNTPPPPFYDQSSTTTGQQQQDQDLFDVDAELAMFTNAEFLDFDAVGRDLSSNMPPEFDQPGQTQTETQPEPDPTNDDPNNKYLDMLNDVKIPDFQYYQSPMLSMQQHSNYPPSAPQQLQAANNSKPGAVGGPSAIQPAPAPSQAQIQAQAPTTPAAAPTPASTTSQSTAGRSANPTPSAASKRKQQDPPALDDGARHAQEEDKRRRNTAASARFRIKKKEREKNLELTVKDVTTKNSTLEARISQLELENRWLKNLVTEKNGSSFSDGDLSGMFNKFRQNTEERELLQSSGEQTQSS